MSMASSSEVQRVLNIGKEVYTEIIQNEKFQKFKNDMGAAEFRIEILNKSHVDESIQILSHAFSVGGGNYEIIKNLSSDDMLPIANGWVDIALKNGLCLVAIENKNNKVCFVGINEVIGFDENVSSKLKLSKRGNLRRIIRNAYEGEDPVWQRLILLRKENALKYGEAMAGISASRADFRGHKSLTKFTFLYWGLWQRNMFNKGVLKYYMGDCTHPTTIAYNNYVAKITSLKYGTKFYCQTSEFDANKYVQTHFDNQQDFVIDDKIPRKMCMYLMDFNVPLSRNGHWTEQLNNQIAFDLFSKVISQRDIYKQFSKL
eukprot:205216_1